MTASHFKGPSLGFSEDLALLSTRTWEESDVPRGNGPWWVNISASYPLEVILLGGSEDQALVAHTGN